MKGTLKRNGIFALLGIFTILLLVGCPHQKAFKPPQPHLVESQSEAGAVSIAAIMIKPWEEYFETLSPKFDLTSEEALKAVLPTTMVQEEKLIKALSAAARIGLPQESVTSSETTTTGAQGTTSVSERTRKKEPGRLPDLYGAATEEEAGSLTGLNDDKRVVGNDPMLQYTAATALYQEVKLLNRYVADAALKRGYKAYVVRVQLNVEPYARNQPYDVYVMLGFFGAHKKRERKQPEPDFTAYVVPLLVTDNLEGALKSRSTDTIRQFAFALSILQSGTAGNLGLSEKQQMLRSVLGTDLNSLLTVGRPTDNTIQVRLGAARQATTSYAMFPRNHYITLVVMVPKELAEEANEPVANLKPQIRVVSNVVMRNAETGKPLLAPDRGARIKNIERVLERHFMGEIPEITVKKGKCETLAELWHFDEKKCSPEDIMQKTLRKEAMDELLFQVLMNNHTGFKKTLIRAGWNIKFKNDLWLDIVKTLAQSDFSGARFDLPFHEDPALPNKQVVFLEDDTGTAKVRLYGGHGLIAERMSAKLKLNAASAPMAATNISVDDQGGNPTLTFPSAVVWKVVPTNLSGTLVNGATLELSLRNGDKWSSTAGTPTKCTFYEVHYRQTEAPKPKLQ